MKSLRAPVIAFLALFSIFWSEPASGQRITYATRDILSGVNNPWEMRMGPDGWIYFTERPGRFSRVNPETGEKKVLWVPEDCVWQHEAGMLGFDFHPDFPDSPFVYIAYTYGTEEQYRYGIFRLRCEYDTLTEQQQIFGPAWAGNSHNGSRLIIRDRKIFFSIGDVWSFEIAQEIGNGNGKINRIELDGSIPADNPFKGSMVWSRGHRNPQGLDFSPAGLLYSSEHGDQTDDEVNLIRRGRNYGWPRIQGFCEADSETAECDNLDAIEPLVAWTPTIATGDLNYYRYDLIPEWQNSLLLASLKDTSLYHLALDATGYQVTGSVRYPVIDSSGRGLGRLRSICISPEGRVFLGTGNGYGTDEYPDRIVELVRTGVAPQVVTLDEPPKAAAIPPEQITFHWSKAFTNASYQFQIARDPEFPPASIIYEKILNSDTDLTFSQLQIGDLYYWRVREITTSGPWSEVWSFVTAHARVDDVQLQPDLKIRLAGRSIELHSPKHDLQVEAFDVLGKLVHIGSLSDGALKIGPFASGVYYLRVGDGQHPRSIKVQIP